MQNNSGRELLLVRMARVRIPRCGLTAVLSSGCQCETAMLTSEGRVSTRPSLVNRGLLLIEALWRTLAHGNREDVVRNSSLSVRYGDP